MVYRSSKQPEMVSRRRSHCFIVYNCQTVMNVEFTVWAPSNFISNRISSNNGAHPAEFGPPCRQTTYKEARPIPISTTTQLPPQNSLSNGKECGRYDYLKLLICLALAPSNRCCSNEPTCEREISYSISWGFIDWCKQRQL